jgi:RNA-binding protein
MIDKRGLKVVGMSMKPTLQVGKSGLTDAILHEIDEQLEKSEFIKIKMLQSMGPSKHWKEELLGVVERLKAELIEIKGGTILLYRKGNKKL